MEDAAWVDSPSSRRYSDRSRRNPPPDSWFNSFWITSPWFILWGKRGEIFKCKCLEWLCDWYWVQSFLSLCSALLETTISANLFEVYEGPHTSDKWNFLIAINFDAMSLSLFSSNALLIRYNYLFCLWVMIGVFESRYYSSLIWDFYLIKLTTQLNI